MSFSNSSCRFIKLFDSIWPVRLFGAKSRKKYGGSVLEIIYQPIIAVSNRNQKMRFFFARTVQSTRHVGCTGLERNENIPKLIRTIKQKNVCEFWKVFEWCKRINISFLFCFSIWFSSSILRVLSFFFYYTYYQKKKDNIFFSVL